MKKVVLLAAAAAVVFSAAAVSAEEDGKTEAAYGTPEIDGTMEDMWLSAPESGIDLFTTETHGASGVFRCMWDEENIYVFAEVTDPVISTVSDTAHMQDSVEIFLDENLGKTEFYEYDDTQYRVSCENARSYSTGAIADFSSAAVITDKGYNIEAAIPFKSIKGSLGKTIGFEIQINDDGEGKGKRTSIAKFNDPTDLSYCNTSLYGELKFAAPPYTYDDLTDSEECDIVAYLTAKGVLCGYDDKTFMPDNTIAREEFLKLLVTMFNIEENDAELSFTDVRSGAWYEQYIKSAVAAGMINGISDTEFGIGRPVTIGEASEMICRAMTHLGVEEDMSTGALEYIKLKGFLDGMITAETNAKRAQSAAMLYKAQIFTDGYLTEKRREQEKQENYGRELIKASGAKEIGNNNPVYTQRFGADPFAMEYDGRIYLYMTGDKLMYDENNDIKDNDYSNVTTISVISSTDLVNWTDHGEIAVAGRTDPDGAAKWASNSWAPSAVHRTIDGKEKFFLYFADNGSGIGVLEADSPTGPFTDPIGGALIKPGVTPGSEGVVWYFDPAVFIDDDGQAYMYFGGGLPTKEDGTSESDHPNTIRVIKLGDDMISTEGEAVAIDAPAVFEDSGIHKYNEKYYYSYCTNFSGDHEDGKYPFGVIAYMTSDDPMGPFVYEGTVLNNMADFFGVGGNNHHAIFSFKDKWYITYHAQTVGKYLGIDKGYRSTHINELTYDENGKIKPVTADYAGAAAAGTFDPYQLTSAASIAWQSGITTAKNTSDDTMMITEADSGDWLALGNVDFGEGASKFTVNAVSVNGGSIELRLDSADGTLIGAVDISGNESEFSCDIENAAGIHDLFFVFNGSGNDLFDVISWRFEK